MTKISRNSMIISRVQRLRGTIKMDTQYLRAKALKNLEELFDMAKDQAKNKKYTLPQRQRWTQVAGYIAQVINSVATGFDEKEIDVQLNELEKLVNETTAKTKAGRSKGANQGKESTSDT